MTKKFQKNRYFSEPRNWKFSSSSSSPKTGNRKASSSDSDRLYWKTTALKHSQKLTEASLQIGDGVVFFFGFVERRWIYDHPILDGNWSDGLESGELRQWNRKWDMLILFLSSLSLFFTSFLSLFLLLFGSLLLKFS